MPAILKLLIIIRKCPNSFLLIRHANKGTKVPKPGATPFRLLWFTYYLFSRQQFAQVDGYSSDSTYVLTGVSQGSILGPLLFILYFNDVVDQLCQCKILMYADNTVFYYGSKDVFAVEHVLTKELKPF